MRSGQGEVTLVQQLGDEAIFFKAANVKSLDIHNLSNATTTCNAHVRKRSTASRQPAGQTSLGVVYRYREALWTTTRLYPKNYRLFPRGPAQVLRMAP